jgi:proline dehydrogenase
MAAMVGRLLRRVFLWASRNRWLRERVPRYGVVRRAVRRFMPGETMDDALWAARELAASGIAAIFTFLGENVVDAAEAAAVADHYDALLGRIAAEGLDGEISVKLTQLGLDLDPELTFGHLERLAARAQAQGSWLWIDMEGSAYTEATIQLYERLRRSYERTGLCLQAYLRRTPADIDRLLPLGPAVRLVKGAYDEPRSIAYTDRREVDAAYLADAVILLRALRGGGQLRLALGTHDVALIEQVAEQAQAAGLGRDAFEVEMLYGIRTSEQRRLARQGYRVRTLITYGDFWYPWYMRRLAERPLNVVFALRALWPR